MNVRVVRRTALVFMIAASTSSVSANVDFIYEDASRETGARDCTKKLEEVLIPVDGGTVASRTLLKKGTRYLLVAIGKFVIGGPGFGDAEYAFDPNDENPIDHCFDRPDEVDALG